jgi:hypothetical protein
MSRQEFVIDETGILGRRFEKESDTIFLPEQIRIINNVLLFTDDGWKTIKTALGKIVYTDPENGEEKEAYGLLAEVLVGSLIMGNTLKIRNVGSSITLDDKGITIINNDIREANKNKSVEEEKKRRKGLSG